ncbi:hypothetical protein EYY90_00735 [Hafnia alvei]|nr:hypothetical protein EYY90_00735 [Hafnia alvei]
MNISQKMVLLLCCFASGTLLSGCMTGGAAFGLGAGAVHETETVEKDPNQPPPVYGPPQIIYRIDSDRYFTLENYVSCEKGETFYNNKKKDIHVKISPASGYLFKGRLYWVSTRDDYLAFPTTHNTKAAVCMGSDKGCKNVITVTTDGGKTLNAIIYGGYTSNPTEDTKDYDIIVTDNGFYTLYYWNGVRQKNNGYVDKWNFRPQNKIAGVSGPFEQGTGWIDNENVFRNKGDVNPELIKEIPVKDISLIKQPTMQCNRSLIPQQKLN